MAEPPSPKQGIGVSGWVTVLVIVLGIYALGQCSPERQTAEETATAQFAQSIGESIELQPASEVKALSLPALREGIADFRKSMRAEALPGAMIFSQNCFDSLSRDFSWRRLDLCGILIVGDFIDTIAFRL